MLWVIKAGLFACCLCLLSPAAFAQWMGHQTGCYAPTIEANPNRPTVANPADITQYGVLELEYGWDRTSLGAGARLSDGAGLLKFGLLCDVELRWTMTSVLVENRQAGGQTGTGDNWFGPQIRIYHQTAHVPTLAFSYAVKAPTASTMKGLGSGRVDHAFAFLASKDIHGVHFDFNATYFLVARPAASGFDSRGQMNLSFSRPIHGKLGFTGEFYGDTELNAENPSFASSLWALTYNISPRLVVDGGIEVGLTHGAPQKRAFAGVTYAITNLYKDLKKK
ncbi:MAG: transporter [Candidatus Acidiferrales bacterium]